MAESNTFSHLHSVEGKFRGIKWKNFTVNNMVRLYGVMLSMRIYPCHIGGYEGYVKPQFYVRVVNGYNGKIFGYGGWEEMITNLLRFRQTR